MTYPAQPGGLPRYGVAPAPPPPARRNRTRWIVVGVAGAVLLVVVTMVVVLVVVAGVGGSSYSYRDDLCARIDTSPVTDRFPVAGSDHRGGIEEGRHGTRVCEYRLETGEVGLSDLRITATTHRSAAQARVLHAAAVESSRTADLGVHEPFDTVEPVSGQWQDGTIFVGNVFRSSDYTVRLVARAENLQLQVDLILSGSDVPRTYGADEELPSAVRQVAENTLQVFNS